MHPIAGKSKRAFEGEHIVPLLFKSEEGGYGIGRERESTFGHDSEFTVRVMILHSSSAPALTEQVLSGGYVILPLHCWLCIARERGNINIDVRASGRGAASPLCQHNSGQKSGRSHGSNWR